MAWKLAYSHHITLGRGLAPLVFVKDLWLNYEQKYEKESTCEVYVIQLNDIYPRDDNG